MIQTNTQVATTSTQPVSQYTATLLRDSVLASLNLVPVVGGFLSYIGALFIPGTGSSTEQMWQTIVDRRISETLFNKVQRDLIGLTDSVTLYRNAISAGNMEEIRETSISVNVLFIGRMPGFQIPGEQVALLPLFAIAATMHLSLLRDMTIKGKDLGLNDRSLANYQRELKNRIESYTKHVDTYVAQAIDNAKRASYRGALARNEPFSTMMKVKTELQLSVGDLRDTWYAFDSVAYPVNVEVMLRREIYTPVVSWLPRNYPNRDNISGFSMRHNSRLKTLIIWDRKQYRTSSLTGFEMQYTDGSIARTGVQIGDKHTLELGDQYISRVEGYQYPALNNLIVYLGEQGIRRQFGRDSEPNESRFQYGWPGHSLSSITSLGESNTAVKSAIGGCVFGFQMINPGPKRISPDVLSQISNKIAPQLVKWIAP